MAIIALHGQRGTGKDTIAEYLYEHHAMKTFSFAEPIYAMLDGCFGVQKDVLEHSGKEIPMEELGGKSIREIAISFGNEWAKQEMGDEVWVNSLHSRVSKFFRQDVLFGDFDYPLIGNDGMPYNGVVISDVRLPVEINFIRKLEIPLWHVRRDTGLPELDHPTEKPAEVIGGDFVLENNGDFGHLFERIEATLRSKTYKDYRKHVAG